MSTSFFITKITVNFPGTGHDYDPIVFKINDNNQIVFGLFCPNSLVLDDPIKIHKLGSKLPSGNSFIMIATSRGQYQLYWNDGDSANLYAVLLQSLTTAKIFPDNQTKVWKGSNSAQNFTLHIDMTQLANGNGISLIPA